MKLIASLIIAITSLIGWAAPITAAQPLKKPPVVDVDCTITDGYNFSVDVKSGSGFADYFVSSRCTHATVYLLVAGRFYVDGALISLEHNSCGYEAYCRVADQITFSAPATLELTARFTIVLAKGYKFQKIPAGCDVISRTADCYRATAPERVP